MRNLTRIDLEPQVAVNDVVSPDRRTQRNVPLEVRLKATPEKDPRELTGPPPKSATPSNVPAT